jgi:molybdopterin-binding protein
MIDLYADMSPAKRKEIRKLSARNILKGQIKSAKRGPISSLIVLQVAPGIEIVSSITAESSGSLKLKKGQPLGHLSTRQKYCVSDILCLPASTAARATVSAGPTRTWVFIV